MVGIYRISACSARYGTRKDLVRMSLAIPSVGDVGANLGSLYCAVLDCFAWDQAALSRNLHFPKYPFKNCCYSVQMHGMVNEWTSRHWLMILLYGLFAIKLTRIILLLAWHFGLVL